jgi:hypothetical protein
MGRSRLNYDTDVVFPCYYKAYDKEKNVLYSSKRKYDINYYIVTNTGRFSEVVFSYEKNGPEYHYYGEKLFGR